MAIGIHQFVQKFGRCGACMRTAAVAALAATGLAALAPAAGLPAPVPQLLALSAALLACNWLAQVAVFALRPVADAPDPGRRATLAGVLRLAAVTLAASLPLAAWSTRALAFCGQCEKDDDCGSGHVCKNTAAVGSGEVCNECVEA